MQVTDAPFTLYPVHDLRRARQFYETVLGLTATTPPAREASGRIEFRIGSHRLVLTAAEAPFSPAPSGGMLALQVGDFDRAVDRLRQEDVTVLAGPTRSPLGRSVVVRDSEGNAVAVVEREPDLSGPAIVHQ